MFGTLLQGCDKLFVSVLLQGAYYKASRSFYIPSPLVHAYFSGIYRACSVDNVRVLVIMLMEKTLMVLKCFFSACHECHSSHMFGYSQLDCYQCSFTVPFTTGTSVDLHTIGQYEVIHKAGSDLIFRILTFWHSSKVDWDSYICLKRPFSGRDFSFRTVSSLSPLTVESRQRPGSEALVFIPGRDVV